MMRMSDDAEFSSAADCPEQHHRKRAYVPYAKGSMAEMELVQHVAKGGKFTPQDARSDRTPAQTIKSMAAFSRTEFPALEDKEAPLAFTRKLREACNQQTDGVYADLEFQNVVSDCIIDQTVTLPALQQKYGLSPKTIQSGLTKVLAYITHGAQVLE